ncbi:hypothetical protein K0U83_00675, partial [bacterium]|nr:hypothetical protein [bacterium]
MSKQIFTPFIQLREFDDQGHLLANGRIYFYESGTTTLGNVYADSTGTPKVNPVQLDGAGTAVIFGDPVAYKIRIVDATGVQIFEIDGAFPFGEGSAGNGLGTLAVCLTYGEVRALSQDYDAILVCGRSTAADGGEGVFFRSPSVAPDNDGTILARSGGSRYVRNFSGYIDPRWFGVIYGVAADQMAPLSAALAVGPVEINGLTCINQDRHLGGALRITSGGFYSTATPKLFLDGRLEDACPGAFGSGIEVILGRRVAREIRTSWFSSVAQSLCSEYTYAYNVDADANPGINLDIPANYAVDFLGGAKWRFTGGYSIEIANLVYQGSGQILSWDAEDHVADIDLGGAISRLEWFGGLSGGAFGVDNRIPMKAAILSGRVDIPEYYRIIDSSTTWASTKSLVLSGVGTLDIDHDFSVASMRAEDLTITGGASITIAGKLDLDGATIANFVEYASAGEDASASVAVPHAYYAVGTGIALQSSDPTTWGIMSGPTGTLRGVWAAGRIMIAGGLGQIWKSADGTAWTSQTLGSGQWNKIKFLNGRWILVGNGGLAYWSLDGDTWNPIATGTTKHILDVDWSTVTGYVIAGEAAMLRTSSDLISWTSRSLPGSPTGDAYALTIGASGRIFLSGSLGGAIYSSDDGTTWTQTILGASDSIYCGASSASETVFGSSSGRIWKSVDNGTTWASTMVGGANFISASYKDGDWLFGSTGGIIYHSFDLVTFSPNSSGHPAPIWGVFTVPPVYAVVGANNSARRSSNAVDWEDVTIPDSGDLRNVRQFFGMLVVVGDSGRVYFSSDFRTFTRAVTGVANNVHDVTYHNGKYIIVGSAGLVMHTPDLFKAAPTWTTEGALTSAVLIRAATDGTNLVICSASTTLTGLSVTTLAPTTTIGGGLFRFGSLWIRYGAGGAIYTSTDKETWTKRISNVTSNLLYATMSTTTVVIASATEITRSNDGITWTASTPVGTLTALAYNGTRGELGYTTTSGAFYTSINNGASWTLSHTAAAGLYGLFVTSNQTWELVGDSGLWTWSSDLSTWYTALGVPSVRLYCGDDGTTKGIDNGYFSTVYNVMVFGASGTIVRRDSYSGLYVSDLTTKLGVSGDIIACADGVILTSAGTVYKTDARGSFVLAVGVASANLSALYHDTTGKRIYATGSDTWSSADANGNYLWEKEILSFSGVQDMEFRDGKFWAVGTSGLLLSSTTGNVWKSQSPIGDATTHYSVDLARAGLSSVLPWARTMAIGSRTVIAGTGGLIQSGAGVAVPTVTANRLDATDATATVDIATEVPGSILRSSLRNVSHIGQTFDSSFSRFSGFLHGNTARTNFVFCGTATVAASIIMAEGSLSKTDATDSTRAPLFALGSSRLQVDLCTIEPNGALVYSTDTGATILLNDCQNSGNFAFPLTNGYAKVYLNRCGNAVRNASAYSIDGATMETADSLTLYTSATVSDNVADWCGLPAGSTSNGTTITLGAAMPLAPSLASTETLRYYGPSTPSNDTTFVGHTPATPTALGMLLSLGGRVKMAVEYPNGYTPDPKCRPAIKLVRPRLEWRDPKPGSLCIYGGALNSSVSAGVVSPSGISSTAGKAIAYANVWGGMQSTFLPDAYKTGAGYGGSDRYGFLDQWGDGGYINGFYLDVAPTTKAYTRSARLVIYNEGTGELPSGTKITVEVIPAIPRSITQFASFFSDPDTSYDTIQKVEKQVLLYRDGQNSALQVVRALNASSSIQTEKQYLSLGTQPSGGGVWTGPYPKDSFTVAITLGLVSTSFIHPTDKSEIFRHIASCEARVDILLPGLDVSNLTTGTYSINGSGAVTNQEFSATTGFDAAKVWWYHRIDRHI